MDRDLFPVFPLFPSIATDPVGDACAAGDAPPLTGAELPQVVAAPELVRPAPAGCTACQHRTRFGNCARPVEADLSERFELIGHPADGAGCAVFEPAALPLPEAVHGAVERIARLEGWSAGDVAHALDVAARCPDAADWLALAHLVEATACEPAVAHGAQPSGGAPLDDDFLDDAL